MMEKHVTIQLGKIAYTGKQKAYMAEVDITLKETSKGVSVSFTGGIWNTKRTDYIACGQIRDALHDFFKDSKLWCEINILWQKYHLNGFHAGTKAQEEYLQDLYPEFKFAADFEQCCKALKQANLYYDQGIAFGHTWHFWPIPKDDLKKIEALMELKDHAI